jgi:phospholipid-translocating ATPase
MIQAANVGVGIEGKEGKQASMAADFSLTQFSHVARLLVWHGRNSYHRSAILSQFIIHRGMVITFIQLLFSAIFYWSSVAMYSGAMLFGYSTFYTSLPIFALVLDEDVSEDNAFLYPELYHQLQKGRALTPKTFFIWCLQTAYQASVITLLPLFIYAYKITLLQLGTFTFTVLTFTQLINVAFEMQSWSFFRFNTWRIPMVFSEVITVALFFLSVVLLPASFGM